MGVKFPGKKSYVTFEWSHSTYNTELIEGVKEFYGEVDVLCIDVGVDEADELCCFRNQIERLQVVWLFPQVVL